MQKFHAISSIFLKMGISNADISIKIMGYGLKYIQWGDRQETKVDSEINPFS